MLISALEWRTLIPNQRATLSLYFVASRYPKTAHTFRRDALRAGPFGFALFEERADAFLGIADKHILDHDVGCMVIGFG